ncbi:MAG: LysR substrate-binding domain-containing protein, partial [Burkholderiales bacterium]
EQRKQILEPELAAENVLLLEDGHCMRDQALAICGSRTPGQWEELKATSLETLRQMVAAGVGCTLLPALAAMPGVGSVYNSQELVQIRPFAPPVPTRTIGLVWRSRYSRQKTVQHLAEVILDNLPAVVQRIQRHAVAA